MVLGLWVKDASAISQKFAELVSRDGATEIGHLTAAIKTD